jgi:tripartite-type tricarboxylate transporter receptor subunit TctC
MSRSMLKTIGLALAGSSLALMAGIAAADYPEREIRLIVPFGPGGSTDIVGRTVATPLADELGQAIVVENRGGAGGTVGTRAAAQADADGYTLTVATTSTHAVGPLAHGEVGYDPIEDFAPISLIAETPYVLIVHPDSGFETMADLVEAALERPGELNHGSAGVGSTTHLAVEMFKDMAGIEAEHIPYDGNAPATTALMGQEIDFLIGSFPAVSAQVFAGEVVALGVGTGQRVAQLPDVPTIEEAGLDGYRASLWLGFAAPAGTPKDIVDFLHAEVVALVENDEGVREALRRNGAEPAVSESPEAFTRLVATEVQNYRAVVERIGLGSD